MIITNMKNFKQNKKYFLVIVSSFLFMFSISYAAVAIVPCGGTGQADCKLSDLSTLFGNTTRVAFQMVSVFAVAMIIYTGFKLMTGKDKAGELADSKERMWKVATGMIIFFGGTGLVLMILRSIGLNSEFLNMFNFFFPTAFLDAISTHAYAVQDPTLLPNPVNVDNPLDFLAILLHLIIRWFVFPCIIFSWLYAGFLYVKAQGNPTEISNAHSWLWWTFIGTVIIMLAEALFSVLRGTITSIVTGA